MSSLCLCPVKAVCNGRSLISSVGSGGLDAVFAEGGKELRRIRHFIPFTGMAVAVRQEGRTAEMVAVEAAILPEEKAIVIRLWVAGDAGGDGGGIMNNELGTMNCELSKHGRFSQSIDSNSC